MVLLKRRDVCIITKQRRLSAKAKFKTASRHKICKKEESMRMNEMLDGNADDLWEKKHTKGQKGDSKIAR